MPALAPLERALGVREPEAFVGHLDERPPVRRARPDGDRASSVDERVVD